MKQIKNILFIIAGVLLMSSCNKKIQELETNPNNPTSVPPYLLLGTVLTDMSGMGSAGSLGGVDSWDNVHRWNQYHCSNYAYYNTNIYNWTGSSSSFDPYLVMQNVIQMDKEATIRGASAVNPYEAVGKFVIAYYYYNLTSMFGDVPQAQALLGAKNQTPVYTPQEQVFEYILNTLDTANSHLATLIANNDNSLSANQDLYYQGNLVQWQKLVNSFKLRVLIALSKKSADANLNIATQFSNIINNPGKYPIFSSQSDDMVFNYNPGGSDNFSTYYFNPSNFGSIAGRYNMASTYVSALTSINDPRVFITCEPAWTLVGSDPVPTKYQYFAGASTGEPLATMYGNANAGLYSNINRYRYFSSFTGEPDVLVGYKEMLFNIAEGIERGWISGNAETFYKAGINESMKFYGIDTTKNSFTAYFLPPGNSSVTQTAPYPFVFSFSSYYAQPAVKLSSTASTAINQIVLQKYISCFQNSGFEAYYNARRTGVPVFQGGSGVGNNGIVPSRWAYPVTEQVQNAKNWNAAIASQQFTADDLNQTMWLLK